MHNPVRMSTHKIFDSTLNQQCVTRNTQYSNCIERRIDKYLLIHETPQWILCTSRTVAKAKYYITSVINRPSTKEVASAMEGITRVLTWPNSKYRRIQQKFQDFDRPYRKWKLLQGACDFAPKNIGIRVFGDCKRTWLTAIPVLCSLQFVLFTIYTMWYSRDKNQISALQPLAAFAILVPVRTKISSKNSNLSIEMTVIWKQNCILYYSSVRPERFKFRQMLQFSGNSIYMDRTPSTDFEVMVDDHAKKLLRNGAFIASFILFAFSLVLAEPIHAYFMHGTLAIPSGV